VTLTKEATMQTRRDFAKLALAGMSASSLLAAKPNSNFGGVEIGVIAPYSFRGMPDDARSLLDDIVKLGLSSVEMQSPPFEKFAGAPIPEFGPRRGPRRPPTEEEIAERRAQAQKLKQWRLSASMDKFREFVKLYTDAGVKIPLIKFGELGRDSSDDELEYFFEVAKAMGVRGITCEPPASAAKRLGEFATRHKTMLYFHGHAAVDNPEAFAKPEAWEKAFSYSKYLGANVDIGHFTAGNSKSPAAFIRKHHDRIANIHLKDRKMDQGPNLPWGQGDTDIAGILKMIQKEKWDIMGTIELEYPVPEGSTVMAELGKCVEYCRKALV
jgi:sugar phosphate isomerase/epimerase